MRNANSQRVKSMILVSVTQQPCMSHVSHAMTEGVPSCYSRQRCALLTMKSRNACTRATVFSSSG